MIRPFILNLNGLTYFWPAAVVAVAMGSFNYIGFFDLAKGYLLDVQFGILRAVYPELVESSVVVIAIDESTLKASNTPLSLWHQHYGDIFEWLAAAKPRVVGFDIVLPERSYDQKFPGFDESLIRGLQALRASEVPVVVAHSIDERRRPKPIYAPFLAFVDPHHGIGSDILIPDDDRVVRRHQRIFDINGNEMPTFARQVILAAGHTNFEGLLNYRITQDISIASAHTFLENPLRRIALQASLTDKIVVIGSVLSDTDRLAQPFPLLTTEPASRQPGVVIQANIISSVLNRSLISTVTGWPVYLLIATSLFLWPFATTVLRAMLNFIVFTGLVFSLTLGLLMAGWYLTCMAAIASALVLSSIRLFYTTYKAQKRLLIARTRIEAQKDFVSAISHDLQTPVGAIISTVDLVKTAKDEPTRERYLAWLGRAAKVLRREIGELLELSKIEAGNHMPKEKPFDLYESIANLYATVLPIAEVKDISVTLAISSAVAPMRRGAQESVVRLLQNLISNALKFTQRGGVSIRVYPGIDEHWVRFEVEDKAGGIPRDKIEELFDKYKRFDEGQPGVGLGMAIVRKLVDSLGGDIYVDSEVGKGTMVRIELPLGMGDDSESTIGRNLPVPPLVSIHPDTDLEKVARNAGISLTDSCPQELTQWVEISDKREAARTNIRLIKIMHDKHNPEREDGAVWQFGYGAAVARDSLKLRLKRLMYLAALDYGTVYGKGDSRKEKHSEESEQSSNILLVDDNEIVLMAWGEVLSNAGFEVKTASDGKEAIRYLKQQQFEVVILDQNMPDILGTELAENISMLDGVQRNLPIILTTAGPLDEVNPLPLSIARRLSKTIEPDTLVNTVREYASRNESMSLGRQRESS